MKLTVDEDRLRLRMSEVDLEKLIADERVEHTWNCPNGTAAQFELMLTPEADADDCQGDLMQLRVALRRGAFLSFAAERPRRDGYVFSKNGLRIDVEVDVRDSHRRRAEKGDMPGTEA